MRGPLRHQRFFPQKLIISNQGKRPEARAPGPTPMALPGSGGRKHTRRRMSYGIRVQNPDWFLGRQATPHPFPAHNRADDELRVRRTHTQPALSRHYVQGSARESRSDTGATRVPPPQLRHPRGSGSASARGLRRSEAAGSGPVSLSGGACGPPLPPLPRWPRAPLLRGESRWRRLWLCEEDGRGGGVEKAASKKT